MSAVLAIASPRRIKATHRRRRKVAAGHFVQRYYDPQVGKFLSVDPVAANGNTGTNFNRYWYAADNPFRFRDPDGRYVCSGEGCTAVDAAYQAGFKKMQAMPNGKERHKLEVAFTAIGRPGKPGAVYQTGSLEGTGKAAQYNPTTKVTTIDPSAAPASWQLPMNLVHEGTHQADTSKPAGPPKDIEGFRKFETSAYQAGNIMAEQFGIQTENTAQNIETSAQNDMRAFEDANTNTTRVDFK